MRICGRLWKSFYGFLRRTQYKKDIAQSGDDPINARCSPSLAGSIFGLTFQPSASLQSQNAHNTAKKQPTPTSSTEHPITNFLPKLKALINHGRQGKATKGGRDHPLQVSFCSMISFHDRTCSGSGSNKCLDWMLPFFHHWHSSHDEDRATDPSTHWILRDCPQRSIISFAPALARSETRSIENLEKDAQRTLASANN